MVHTGRRTPIERLRRLDSAAPHIITFFLIPHQFDVVPLLRNSFPTFVLLERVFALPLSLSLSSSFTSSAAACIKPLRGGGGVETKRAMHFTATTKFNEVTENGKKPVSASDII